MHLKGKYTRGLPSIFSQQGCWQSTNRCQWGLATPFNSLSAMRPDSDKARRASLEQVPHQGAASLTLVTEDRLAVVLAWDCSLMAQFYSAPTAHQFQCNYCHILMSVPYLMPYVCGIGFSPPLCLSVWRAFPLFSLSGWWATGSTWVFVCGALLNICNRISEKASDNKISCLTCEGKGLCRDCAHTLPVCTKCPFIIVFPLSKFSLRCQREKALCLQYRAQCAVVCMHSLYPLLLS